MEICGTRLVFPFSPNCYLVILGTTLAPLSLPNTHTAYITSFLILFETVCRLQNDNYGNFHSEHMHLTLLRRVTSIADRTL